MKRQTFRITRKEFLALPVAVRRKVLKRQADKFSRVSAIVASLERKAEHYRTAKEDPYNINTAVYVALLEFASVFK